MLKTLKTGILKILFLCECMTAWMTDIQSRNTGAHELSPQMSVHRQDRNNTMNKDESINLSKVKWITEIQPQELCIFQAGNAHGNEIKHQQKLRLLFH